MDEKNGEIFDHHAELFAQIGTIPESEPLRDFLLDSSGMIEAGGIVKNVPSVPVPDTGSVNSGISEGSIWTHGYSRGEPVVNHSRNAYGLQPPVPPVSVPGGDVENTSALIDSLVKSIPSSENVLGQYSSLPLVKNVECRSENVNHVPNPLFGGLHRISTDKVTQDFLDNLNKLEPGELKCDSYENLSWNGVNCDPLNNLNYQSQNRLASQAPVDKNGNSALFDGSHVEKISAEQFPQNNFRLSPSASVETNVRTPATSLESASPLSSNRTPLRSDESISPMGSGHTPLRVEDSTSPLASIKTPLRVEEGSPMGRTPLRMEESFSPAGTSSGLTPSPSHKPNGQAPQGFENYNSPPSIFKKADTRSPISSVLPSPVRADVVETGNEVRLGDRGEGCKKSSPRDASPTGSVEALIRQQAGKKIPIPFVSAKRIDDSLVNRKTGKRTLPSKSEDESGSSSSSKRSENESESSAANASSGVKTETEVPEVAKDENYDAQRLSEKEDVDTFSEQMFSKFKKRRKKSDSLCLPSVKRRSRKRVTIYQSSMSPEETGIKLKIKLAPSFQRVKPQKKRRSKKSFGSDEEEENSGSKRCKKSVRFSSKERDASAEQTEWGNKIPPEILQKIFHVVVEDQGCVPSLVRFSSVCKLWNTVANRPELWQNIDLSSPYIKQKCKIDRYFRWLLENRLGNIRDLNLNGWKFSNITMVLSLIGAHCTEIESIGLAGWQGLHYEHLKSLLQDCPRLSKLDLSDVSPESKSANSAVSQKSITFLTQTMGERLTQLILAHNTLTCLPQIISSLATHCPNLQVLDLSNIRRVSHTEFALNIEHLQEGCQKLRVLRITNSCITLANVPLEKQVCKTSGIKIKVKAIALIMSSANQRRKKFLLTFMCEVDLKDQNRFQVQIHPHEILLSETLQKLRKVASPGFASLEELSIAGHQGTESLRITSVMDDSCLERILKTSHKLKLLDVRGCTRITDSSLVRVPAWDIQHLFLSGCYVTRQCGSGLELIAQKWCHSLVEIDLAWTTVTEDLNAAIMAFAEKGAESPLRVMNLCGSSVTLEPVKALLSKCRNLESLNLQSCRGLPRGVKRLYENEQVTELRNMLEKKDRDSASEGEDRKETEAETRMKESPMYSTNNKDDDLVT